MPLNIDVVQILLHMLNFIILAGGLTLILFRPVCKFLDERKKHFEDLEAENRQKAEQNEKLLLEYEEKLKSAQIEIEQMRKNAEKETAAVSKAYIDDAKKKADAIILDAQKEAEERKEHILDSAQTEIGELVVSATQKLLGDTVTAERNSGLYDEFIRRADSSVADKRVKK